MDPVLRIRAAARLFDFSEKPSSRAGWIVRILCVLVALTVLSRKFNATVGAQLLKAKPTPVVPTEDMPGFKFRLSEDERRKIFAELATAELAERKRAIDANTWQGHAWSREDDRGWYERVAVRQSAARHHVSLTQVYLVLDEGIREHWLAPDGKPLPATTPPLNPRTGW